MITKEVILEKINSNQSLNYEDFMLIDGKMPHQEISSPLMFACNNNDYDLVYKIIQHGVDVNYENKGWQGWRALRYAFFNAADSRILKLLLSQSDIDCCFTLVDGRDLIESSMTSFRDPVRLKISSKNVSVMLKSGKIPELHINKNKLRYLKAGVSSFCEEVLVPILKNVKFNEEEVKHLYKDEFEDILNILAVLKRLPMLKKVIALGVDINGTGSSTDGVTIGHNFFSISADSSLSVLQAKVAFDFLYENNFDFNKENNIEYKSSTLDVLQRRFPDLFKRYNILKDFEKLNVDVNCVEKDMAPRKKVKI